MIGNRFFKGSRLRVGPEADSQKNVIVLDLKLAAPLFEVATALHGKYGAFSSI